MHLSNTQMNMTYSLALGCFAGYLTKRASKYAIEKTAGPQTAEKYKTINNMFAAGVGIAVSGYLAHRTGIVSFSKLYASIAALFSSSTTEKATAQALKIETSTPKQADSTETQSLWAELKNYYNPHEE